MREKKRLSEREKKVSEREREMDFAKLQKMTKLQLSMISV